MDTHVDRKMDANATKYISGDYPVEDGETLRAVVMTDGKDIIRHTIPKYTPLEGDGVVTGQWPDSIWRRSLSREKTQTCSKQSGRGYYRGNAGYKP
jgi:hypothetical protein